MEEHVIYYDKYVSSCVSYTPPLQQGVDRVWTLKVRYPGVPVMAQQ